MTAKAIPVDSSKQNTIDIQWNDVNETGVDMTGFTLSGDILWSGGSLNVDAMFSYVSQSTGLFRIVIPQASAALIPTGAASTITVTATSGGIPTVVVDDHPVFVE